MGRVFRIFIISTYFIFSCAQVSEEDVRGDWTGEKLIAENGDSLYFQKDRRPHLVLGDSTFSFVNRHGQKLDGSYEVQKKYLLFRVGDSTTVVNKIRLIEPDSLLTLEMQQDSTVFDLYFRASHSIE